MKTYDDESEVFLVDSNSHVTAAPGACESSGSAGAPGATGAAGAVGAPGAAESLTGKSQ